MQAQTLQAAADPETSERSLIVMFEGLNPRQFGIVNEVINAVGQFTCEGAYLYVPDATAEDVDLIWGLSIVAGCIDVDRAEPLDPVRANAWRAARARIAAWKAAHV